MGLWTRFRNRRFDDDLREELRAHEEMKREALRATGLPADEAKAAARRAMGNTTLMREDARAVWVARWIDGTIQDIRYAVRSIAGQPLVAVTSIVVLVLAIGLNASLFTMFKGVALAQWPATNPDRIVQITAMANGRQQVAPSLDEYRFIGEHATTLKGIAAHVYGAHLVQAPGRSGIGSQSRFVTASFFPLLGARMHLGAGFIPDDDLPGRRAVAVLAHYFWRTYLGGDPSIVGQTLKLNGKPYTVIGVLDAQIDGLYREVHLWLPFSSLPSLGPVMAAGLEAPASANCCIQMIARLADGVDTARARQELQILHQRFATAAKRSPGTVQVRGTAAIETMAQDDLALFAAIGGAVLLILALGCANVGNLQLARGLARP